MFKSRNFNEFHCTRSCRIPQTKQNMRTYTKKKKRWAGEIKIILLRTYLLNIKNTLSILYDISKSSSRPVRIMLLSKHVYIDNNIRWKPWNFRLRRTFISPVGGNFFVCIRLRAFFFLSSLIIMCIGTYTRINIETKPTQIISIYAQYKRLLFGFAARSSVISKYTIIIILFRYITGNCLSTVIVKVVTRGRKKKL